MRHGASGVRSQGELAQPRPITLGAALDFQALCTPGGTPKSAGGRGTPAHARPQPLTPTEGPRRAPAEAPLSNIGAPSRRPRQLTLNHSDSSGGSAASTPRGYVTPRNLFSPTGTPVTLDSPSNGNLRLRRKAMFHRTPVQEADEEHLLYTPPVGMRKEATLASTAEMELGHSPDAEGQQPVAGDGTTDATEAPSSPPSMRASAHFHSVFNRQLRPPPPVGDVPEDADEDGEAADGAGEPDSDAECSETPKARRPTTPLGDTPPLSLALGRRSAVDDQGLGEPRTPERFASADAEVAGTPPQLGSGLSSALLTSATPPLPVQLSEESGAHPVFIHEATPEPLLRDAGLALLTPSPVLAPPRRRTAVAAATEEAAGVKTPPSPSPRRAAATALRRMR